MFTIPKNRQLSRFYSVFSAETIFNQENIKKTIDKFATFQPVRSQTKSPTKNAAVLVPVCVIDGRVSLLYTIRAANLKRDRGHVSFPGGMEDAADATAEHTAIRETQEELGIDQDQIEIWGKGNIIMSRDVTSVLPVIGRVKISNIERDLKVNSSEVKEVFTVPLEVLSDPLCVRHTQFRGNYSMPVFTGGRRKIWGLTAIITHLFLRSLLPRNVYNPSIKYIPPLRGGVPRTF